MDVLSQLISDAGIAESMTECHRRGTAARVSHGNEMRAASINGSAWCNGIKGNCGCLHAEVRAVLSALRDGAPQGQCELWVTLSPCTACANLCVSSKLFKRVVYLRPLEHDLRGIDILRLAGIEVVKGDEA